MQVCSPRATRSEAVFLLYRLPEWYALQTGTASECQRCLCFHRRVSGVNARPRVVIDPEWGVVWRTRATTIDRLDCALFDPLNTTKIVDKYVLRYRCMLPV